MFDNIAYLFERCLNKSQFPEAWKIVKLVLIPKSDSKFRPNDIGKALKRIIADRIKDHLDKDRNAKLSDFQFGFREGKCTIDALNLAKEFIDTACAKKKFTVAISIDIRNAFNTLPWKSIFTQMERKDFPPYLVDIIRSYFYNRKITYPDYNGNILSRIVFVGVPQGSVLSPLL